MQPVTRLQMIRYHRLIALLAMTATIMIPAPVALRLEGIRAETRVVGAGVALTPVEAATDRNLFDNLGFWTLLNLQWAKRHTSPS
jgi:hypothetical protein